LTSILLLSWNDTKLSKKSRCCWNLNISVDHLQKDLDLLSWINQKKIKHEFESYLHKSSAKEESWCMKKLFRKTNNQSNQNHLMQNKNSREQRILVEYQLFLSRYLTMHLKTRKHFITFETWISWDIDWRKMKTLWSKREWIFEMRAFFSWTSTIKRSWNLKSLSLNTIIVLTNWTMQNSWFVSWRSNYEKRIWKIQIFFYLSLKIK
jgi:hypothetical protein